MNFKRFPRVSQVISIIVLIVVTALLLAFQYSWNGHPHYYGPQTPTVRLYSIEDDDENFTIMVDVVDPDTARIFRVEYALLNESGKTFPGNRGDLRDILNLDFEHENTNISFQDNDGDGNITGGDVFLIKNEAQGGQAKEGYSLILTFKPTGENMNLGGTKLR